MKTTILLFLVFLCLSAGSPHAGAVVPPPDGGYPGFNTAEGQNALFSLTTGVANTAVGWFSLFSNTDGSYNTAVGAGTLLFNIGDQGAFEGVDNTAVGAAALLFNTTGTGNTAVGAQALLSNTEGTYNTVTGALALSSNTTGNFNVANGNQALRLNTEGNANTAVGLGALWINTEGDDNTAIGRGALANNTTGSFNTAVGNQTLESNTSGSFNIALRGGANLTTGNFNIDIGSDGVAGESGTIRIGDGCCQSRAFIAGIFGTAVSGSTVVVDANGQLGVAPSSIRFKDEIKPMGKASEAIFSLRPVAFQYKSDSRDTPQFGLIAEEVAALNPDLVVSDENGEIYTVRYDAVNAMLLNEFLKEHHKNEEQQSQIEQQERKIERQQKQIEALTAGLQKVSAQLELSNAAPRTVLNNQ